MPGFSVSICLSPQMISTTIIRSSPILRLRRIRNKEARRACVVTSKVEGARLPPKAFEGPWLFTETCGQELQYDVAA